MSSALACMWSARTVAVIGASDRSAVHRLALTNLVAPRSVRVHGVNPKRHQVQGVPCVPTVADLPERPDVAVLLVGDRHVEAAAVDAAQGGARLIVVPGLGASPANREVRERLAATVAAAGATLVGPDCMGVLAPGRLQAWIGTLCLDLRSGHLGIASHSGAVAEALTAFGPRYGYRGLVSLGLEGGADVADACELFAEDEGTEAVGLFLEVVRRPAALLAALHGLAEVGKPVVVLRTGESPAARAAAHAHNEMLPGDDESLAACLRSTGAIQAGDFAEFAETLAILDGGRRPAGRRIVGITNSGGEAALLADEAHRAGIPAPPFTPDVEAAVQAAVGEQRAVSNPVDGWSTSDTAGAYHRTIALLVASGDFDIVVAQIDQGPHLGALERRNAVLLAQALVDQLRGSDAITAAVVNGLGGCPIPEVTDVLAGSGVLLLGGPRPALRALAALAQWRPATAAEDVSAPPTHGAANRAPAPLADLLAAHGFTSDGVHGPADTRWPVLEMVARGSSPFGPLLGVRAMGGRVAWALAPAPARVLDELVRDAGLAELPAELRAAVTQRLAALSALAGAGLRGAALTLVHGWAAHGLVLLGWHAQDAGVAPEPTQANAS